MLQNIRDSTKSGWTYVLVAVLIVIFAVFFGVPGDSCSSGGPARRVIAKVGPQEIYNDDVNLIFNRMFGNQRRVTDEQILSQQATSLKSLVLVELLAEKAREMGLRVGDEELNDYIKDPLRNPEFAYYARDGKYDGKYLKAHIQNRLRVQISRYEEFKRTELLAIKYMTLLQMQFHGSDTELKSLHELRNNKVDLEFAKFDEKAIAEFVDVSEEDITAFLASDAAAVKKSYEANAKTYETPEQYQIRRIFITKPEDEAKLVKASEKFADAKERVMTKKENFGDVAGDISEDYAKEKQGLMDWTDVANLDENITSVLKDAKVGDVKEVETKFAYMLVKLEGKKEASKTELSTVERDIAKQLLQEKRVKVVKDEMVAQFRTALEGNVALTDALKSLKPVALIEGEDPPKSKWDAVTIDSTGMFTLEGQDLGAMFGNQFPNMMGQRMGWNRVPKIGESTPLATEAFKLTKENPTSKTNYRVADATFIVRLKERETATEESLTENQVKLTDEIRGDKLGPIIGNPTFFLFPSEDFGDFFETIYDEAVENGKVKLYEKRYDAIPLVKRKSDKDEAPKEDAVKEGETVKPQIKVKPSGG